MPKLGIAALPTAKGQKQPGFDGGQKLRHPGETQLRAWWGSALCGN
jgi:hypothetical protein